MTPALSLYMALERAVMARDEVRGGADFADQLREVMDKIWHQQLTAEERDRLNGRASLTHPAGDADAID